MIIAELTTMKANYSRLSASHYCNKNIEMAQFYMGKKEAIKMIIEYFDNEIVGCAECIHSSKRKDMAVSDEYYSDDEPEYIACHGCYELSLEPPYL